jgi:hypothetical protein
MSGERFCSVCRQWHRKDEPWPVECTVIEESKRSNVVPMPYIVTDSLPDVRNPLDGKIYDSKSAYYKKVKESGCEILGNDFDAQHSKPEYNSSNLGDVILEQYDKLEGSL